MSDKSPGCSGGLRQGERYEASKSQSESVTSNDLCNKFFCSVKVRCITQRGVDADDTSSSV